MRLTTVFAVILGGLGILLGNPRDARGQEKSSVQGWLPEEPMVQVRADFKTLWRGPLFQEMRTAILRGGAAYALLQLQMSPQLEEIDEIAGAVWMKDSLPPEFLLAIGSSGPVDVEKAAKTFLGPQAKAVGGSQKNLWRAEHPIRLAVVAENELLIGTEGAIVEALVRKKQPKKGGKFSEGHLAIRVAKEPKLGVDYEGAVPEPFKPLAAAKSVLFNLTAAPKSLNLTANLEYVNEKDAEKALGSAEEARKMGLKALAEWTAEMGKEIGAGDKDLLEHGARVLGLGGIKLLTAELEKFPVTREGANLSATLVLENRQTAQLGPLLFMSLYGVSGARMMNPPFRMPRDQAIPQPPMEAARSEPVDEPAVVNPFEAATRARSANNLKQIGIAIHNFHDVNGYLPPAFVTDKEGKPLYSWRVLLLPYLEQEALYRKWNLDEAWDSPTNKPLSDMVMRVFSDPKKPSSKTHYRIFVGEKSGWVAGPKGWLPGKGKAEGLLKFPAFTDGLSNTLAVVEAKEAIPWAAPEEFSYDGKKALPDLAVEGRNTFAGLLFDGSVRQIKKGTDQKILRLMIERADGNPLPEIR